MPDCVRPGGVTDVLLVVVIGLDVVEVVEEIVVGAWTQQASPAMRDAHVAGEENKSARKSCRIQKDATRNKNGVSTRKQGVLLPTAGFQA